jgi:hypothetical protein
MRAETGQTVIEPASLTMPNWQQPDYLELWSVVIERFVRKLVVMPGWEMSAGCVYEVEKAYVQGIPVYDLYDNLIERGYAIESIRRYLSEVPAILRQDMSRAALRLEKLDAIAVSDRPSVTSRLRLRKDESLNRLADLINVAQFVSFSPSKAGALVEEFSRVLGRAPNERFGNPRHAIGTLLERSPEGSVNLRSYSPDSPQSREFIYGLRSLEDAVSAAARLAAEGLHVIVNETVDVADGGISGVAWGDIVEFVPDDTPRGVEKPGVAALPRRWAQQLLSTVYGFAPQLTAPEEYRLEFSIHPKPRGWRMSHTIGWELSGDTAPEVMTTPRWPNNFSRLVGDKAYGLLVGHVAGLPVPHTTILNRRLAPFSFGRPTGSAESWLRTSPAEQVPGRYTTQKGWMDPFRLMQSEDPNHLAIASILAQASVRSLFAGAAIVLGDGRLVVEGARGDGDALMLGVRAPETLPVEVQEAVERLNERAVRALGPVRFEWAFDGSTAWLIQLHPGATQSQHDVIVPGQATRWVSFNVTEGLSALRNFVHQMAPDEGLTLVGDVGLTSHVADVVRKAGVPTRLASRP